MPNEDLLSTPASKIMSPKVVCTRIGASYADVIRTLMENRITGMPVLDENGEVAGIISEYDIIRWMDEWDRKLPYDFSLPIDYVSTHVESVTPETPFKKLLVIFSDKKLRRVPVLDASKKLVGIISRRDVIKLLHGRI